MSFSALPLSELSAAFRQRGALFARIAPEAARTFEECAEWLETSLAAQLERPLTLEEACAESGWSYEGLRRRLKEEPTLNAGGAGAPLIRRCDLPRLGAPRGPRGPYGSRAATAGEHAASSTRRRSKALGVRTTPDRAMSDAPTGADDESRPMTQTVASRSRGGVDSDAKARRGEADVQDGVESEADGSSDAEAPPKRSQSAPRKMRASAAKGRFDHLLALAARQ